MDFITEIINHINSKYKLSEDLLTIIFPNKRAALMLRKEFEKIDGNICSFHISNIREWTTYLLRCYYQKYILGRTSFANVFDDRQVITPKDLPIEIRAISPEGNEQMKKFFKTST